MKLKQFTFHLFEAKIRHKNERTIVIYHGWGSTVESCMNLAEEIAKMGHRVLVPEIIYHDTRSPLPNHFNAEVTQTYFWETIYESIDEFNDFVAELGIPMGNIVLVGSSMGGFIANGIFANHKNLGGLVNINGSGSFLLSEKIFRERDNRTSLPFKEQQRMMKYNPVEKTKSNSPILLMHGDSDTTVSIKGQEDYYHTLTETEGRENVKFRIYENNNHQFTSEMMKDLLEWLNK